MSDEKWVFTFGSGHALQGYYVTFSGDYDEARSKMCAKFGTNWAFQYSAKEWAEWEKDTERGWIMEKELILNGD